MSSIPKYSAYENIIRIQMEKGVNFVVVEGEADAVVYESVLHSIMTDDEVSTWDVVHVGGKTNIRELISQCSTNNYICIADKDFDDVIDSEKVVSLSRYSIENFLICEEAISVALSIALKAKYADVFDRFSLERFFNEVENNGKSLLYALFYYHRVVNPVPGTNKVQWGDACVHKNPPDWGLCENKITSLIGQLLPDEVSLNDAKSYFDEHFHTSGNTAYDLPGKMLRVLLQRYVYEFYRTNKPRGGAQFKSPDSFMASIAASLNRSTQFVREVNPIVSFLRA